MSIPVTSTAEVATDLAGGVHYQRMKLDGGADGSSAPIPGDSANGLDVDVTRLPALPAGSNLIGKVASVMVTADADLTQLITVPIKDTAVQGPAVTNPGGWILKSDPANTGSVWFMFHGQTKALKGFPLAVGESMMVPVESLADLDFDADTNGNKIHAAKL